MPLALPQNLLEMCRWSDLDHAVAPVADALLPRITLFKPHVFLVHAFRTAGLAAQAATVSAMVLRRTAERVRQALNGI